MSTARQPDPGWDKLGSHLVYVVDDETMVGDVVQIILRMGGYSPHFFADPELALESLRQDPIKPDLLLTDFRMTPLNGMELIARCKVLQPSLKTILYSGNAGEDVLRQYPVQPDGFLHKPFLPKTLLALIHRVLDGAATTALVVGGSMVP
jgi:DNA-binding NtrC family response regulator